MPTTFDFIEDTAKSFDFQPDVEESPSQRPVIAFPGERSPRIASTGPLTPFEAGQIPSKVSQALSAPRVPELTGAEAENLLMTPQVTIPNPVPPSWPIARGLVQTAKSIPEFLTAPAAPEILMAQRIPFVREAIDAAIGAGMVKSAAELAGESSVTGDREKMAEAISSGVLGATMIGAPHVAPMVANEVAARRVGRPDLTQVDVEAFPGPANIIRIPDVVEQAQRGGLFTQEALQGAKTVTAPVPRGPRPFVPETPPEIERGLTVIQEIRAKGADTKEKIRALFPQLSRETAAKLRNQAFPREKIPDNLSRQDVDRLFLDKLNEESNREIEQAFQEKAPEPVPQVPATPTSTPPPEPPPTAPEAKAPEVGPVELNGTKFSQHSHALVSKDPVSGKWRLTVFDEFTGTGEIIPAGHEEYASRQDALDSAKELDYAEKPSEPTPPAKVEAPAAKPAAETGKEIGAPEPTELYLSWSPKEGGTIMGENRRNSADVISWAKKQIESLRQEVKDYRSEEQKNRQAYKESPNRRVMGGLAPESLRAAGAKAKKLEAQAKIDFLKSRIEEHQRQIKATEKPSETPPTGPGMVGLGGATPSEFPTAPSNFRHWWDQNFGKPAAKVAPTIKALWNGHQIREGMAYLKDWVENGAKLFARSTANDIRQPLRRLSGKEFKLADNALSMVIEAKGKPEALDEMRIKLIDSTKADPWWRKQALDALDYAVYHWNELNKLADDYKGITSTQVDVENASNIPTLRREGYVPHRQEIEELDLLTTSGQGQSTFFEKPRAHDTFADSIAAGVDPKSLSATDLLEHRLSSGTRLVNSRKWMDTLRGWKDPTTGAPIATNLQPLKRADGSTVMVPPTGYVSEMVGPHSVAILKGYVGTAL